MTSSQHRCVFVGNIPYDATEEQLIQICEEVGPVVSFRLVVDRETGKPKGYGFCEFRDEETALSARRNLQGYEINGRQLRVDFAENEKGNSGERSRDQGRRGPGVSSLSSSADAYRQGGNLGFSGGAPTDHSFSYAAAAAAATVMVGALGGPHQPSTLPGLGLSGNVQDSGQTNGHPGLLKADPLTSYLATMSKNQLLDVLSQMKAFAQQNQQEARQILTAKPHWAKALLQVEILLGMVHPQQLSQLAPSSMPSQTTGATIPSPANVVPQLPLYPQQPQTTIPSTSQGISSQQLLPPLPSHPRPFVAPPAPLIPPTQMQAYPSQSLGFLVPPAQQQLPLQPAFQVNYPQFSTGMTFQPQGPLPLPLPQPLFQQNYQVGLGKPIAPVQMIADSGSAPSITQTGSLGPVGMGLGSFTPIGRVSSSVPVSGVVLGSTLPPAVPLSRELDANGAVQSGQIGNTVVVGSSGISEMDFTSTASISSISSSITMNVGQSFLAENTRMPQRSIMLGTEGSLDGGFGTGSTTQPQVYGQAPVQGLMQPSQHSQVHIPAEVDQQKVLLQQVINLTPEQINSLPPDQRQQVLQLQQALGK